MAQIILTRYFAKFGVQQLDQSDNTDYNASKNGIL